MTTVTLTPASTSPWTVPAGVTSLDVQCWGEGGSGGHGVTNTHAGGGGGGGEYAEETTLAVSGGSNCAFTIGAGGTGTNTTFTGASVTVTAHFGGSGAAPGGGSGGSGSTNSIHNSGGAGGSGGTGTGLKSGGAGGGSAGAGGAGGAASGTVAGTAGAGSPAGAAGAAGAIGTGTDGTTPGSGASGGGSSSTVGAAGGNGGDGQIVITYTATTLHSGTATLTGSGTLAGRGAFAGTAPLSGSGTLAWSGTRILKATVLSGSGTLSGSVIGTISEAVTLTGSGTLAGAGTGALFSFAALTGSGTLSVPGVVLGNTGVLSGTGTLSIIGTGGTVQAAAGASVPQAYPGSSQVSVAAPGSSSWQYLGTLGAVSALTYSYVCPGGSDQLTCTVMIPATYRNQMLNPGWQVRVTRGGHQVWSGKLDEPVYGSSGVQLTAVGDGNRGTDFAAVYSGTWPAGIPDDPVNEAIARGLPWHNPGIGSPSGIWTGQEVDSGSSTITDLLNLVCTRGGLTWYASSQPGGSIGTDLSVFPLPTTVNRLLIVTDPVARTLGGDINTIFIRYEISDGVAAGTTATYGLTSVTNAQSVAAHGVIETYMDLSSAGVMSAGAAQAVGNNVLQVYQRASFAGPFTASYGQLLNAGGAPVDPGTDQAGTVVRLILTDFAYGGEVTMAPITFIVGAYLWDDFAQQAQISPQAMLDQSLSGLLSEQATVLTPITVSS